MNKITLVGVNIIFSYPKAFHPLEHSLLSKDQDFLFNSLSKFMKSDVHAAFTSAISLLMHEIL